jgi:hypothetical protein
MYYDFDETGNSCDAYGVDHCRALNSGNYATFEEAQNALSPEQLSCEY